MRFVDELTLDRCRCPHCRGDRFLTGLRLRNLPQLSINLAIAVVYAVAQIGVALVWLLGWFYLSNNYRFPYLRPPRLGLHRRCAACGTDVLEGDPQDSTSCGQCGYNLIGTLSDRCPECGWVIPEMRRVLLHYETRAKLGIPLVGKTPSGPRRPGARRTA